MSSSEAAREKHQPATGVGALRHDDPADRPPAVYDGEVTLHLADRKRCYLLLPVVPPLTTAPSLSASQSAMRGRTT